MIPGLCYAARVAHIANHLNPTALKVSCIQSQFCADERGILLIAMFGLTKNSPDATCGVILDIASARVDIQIVIADPLENSPMIVWSHTERVLASEVHTFEILSKKIITASANAFLALGSQGMKTLHAYDPHAKITICDVLFGTPWAHTVTQKISYHKETPFEITEPLLEDILQKAEVELLANEKQEEILTSLDAVLLHKKTNGCLLNGYLVQNPIDKTVSEFDVQQTVGVAHAPVVEGVKTSYETIVQKATLHTNTKIARLKEMSTVIHAENTPYALMLISGEATEIGFLSGESLQTSTYAEWGHNTVIRYIMEASKRPYADVLSMLTQPAALITQQLEAIRAGFSAEIQTLIKDHVLRTISRLQVSDHSVTNLYFDVEESLRPLFSPVFETLVESSAVACKNVQAMQITLQDDGEDGSKTSSILASVFHITHAKK